MQKGFKTKYSDINGEPQVLADWRDTINWSRGLVSESWNTNTGKIVSYITQQGELNSAEVQKWANNVGYGIDPELLEKLRHSKCPYCNAHPKPCKDGMHITCCGCFSNEEFYFTGTPAQWEEQVQIMKRQKEEDKGVVNHDTLGGKQDISVINESGLYSLILKSKKPEAKKFKRWVTSEVLPALRKRGSYGAPQAIDMNNLAALVATATAQATTQILEQTLKLQNSGAQKSNRLQVEPLLLPSLERGNIRDRVHRVAKATPFGEREIYDCLYRNLALMPEFQKYKASFFAARKDRGTSALAWLDSLGLLPLVESILCDLEETHLREGV